MALLNDRYLFTGSDDQTVTRLDFPNQNQPYTVERFPARVRQLFVSEYADHLLCILDDDSLVANHLTTGSVSLLRAEGHPISTAAFTSRPDRIVTGARERHDLAANVWDVTRRRVMRNLRGRFSVTRIDVSQDQRYVAAAGMGGEDEFLTGAEVLRIWELNTGREVATFCGEAPASCMASNGSGVYLIGDYHGAVHVLRLIEP